MTSWHVYLLTSVCLPRYRTLFLWLYAKPDVLNPRLDTRVDEMMQVRPLKYLAAQLTHAHIVDSSEVCFVKSKS